MRLALKRFRGEPAISWFVWHFTPYHSSSANFATLVGAGLHGILLPLHPGHGKLTRFRVYPLPLTRPIQTRFRYGFGCASLNLATEGNSPDHSPKGTPSGIAPHTWLSPGHSMLLALRPVVSLRFQVLFHSPHRGAFHLSLTVLVHYRSQSVFSLGEWSPRIPTGLHGSGGTQVPGGSFSVFAYGTVTLFGRLSHTFLLTDQFFTSIYQALQPLRSKLLRFGLFRVRSPLLTESR